jgi:hypothetical protein
MLLLRVVAWAFTGASAFRARPFAGRWNRFGIRRDPPPFGKPSPQLVSHVTAGQTAVPPEFSLTAVNSTASVVGLLALLSLAFVDVTLIRRRITS